ncbi:restriction endonuclease subunit S [Undibacterium sp. WLX3042]|uniref:restriction endonuclease subunit S n=1 Tax=Undibacterium sp. WLX3042 TaxID=3412686 RepID=UPI003C2D9699
MSRYKAYPEYKDSGVEWLGDIPSDWDSVRLKFAAELCGSKVDAGANERYVGLENIESGNGMYLEKEAVTPEGQSTSFSSGDVLFGKLRPYLAKSWMADFSGICSSEFLVLKSKKVCPRFLNYYTLTDEFISQVDSSTYGSKMPRASWDFIGLLEVPIPVNESQKIANFLDHETAKIDTLIAKQQELIKLLKEKRQAVISHAVTKGLNPNAPMRDSGIEWLGEVPAHWVVCSLKYKLKSLDFRRVPLSAEERGSLQGEYRYYGASGVIDHIDDFIFDEPTILVGEDGANLVNRSTPLAFPVRGRYWVNNHAHILKPDDGLVEYWAETIEHIDINPIVSGSAQPKLTAENLNNLKIAFPPSIEERIAITDYLEIQKKKFNELIERSAQGIDLLHERRTALISAAVTGKIDVRDWQPPSDAAIAA